MKFAQDHRQLLALIAAIVSLAGFAAIPRPDPAFAQRPTEAVFGLPFATPPGPNT